MPSSADLRDVLRRNLDSTIQRVNDVLAGQKVEELQVVLERIGRGQQLPHWYEGLRADHSLPNLDGKTIGSVIEMLLVAVLETHTFKGLSISPLRINPARGVDLPDLDLGIKSPSENYCTSEPFFSAYERLLGSEHDILVLITDYQDSKKSPPLRLRIIQYRYLLASQIADRQLCRIALKHREWLLNGDESRAKRVFRFLAYVNQSDWRARRILSLIDILNEEPEIRSLILKAEKDFAKTNKQRLKADKIPIPEQELAAFKKILDVSPLYLGVIDAADNWVVEVQKDTARAPNDNEWKRLVSSPLDGLIGMSLALQWRYNFGQLFGAASDEGEEE